VRLPLSRCNPLLLSALWLSCEVAVCCMLLGCGSAAPAEKSADYRPVASFIPSEVNPDRIDELLGRNGISHTMSGSRAYQILVPRAQLTKARSVLKAAEFRERLTIYSP
jgi:hypothetical protein